MSQTTATPPSDSSAPAPASSRQRPGTWRWVARGFLILWWAFIVALLGGIAQYLGSHAGPFVIPLLPQVFTWLRLQPLLVQIGLVTAALALLGVMVWLTVLAWRRRQQQVIEQEEADLARQAEAVKGALDEDVNPRLVGIQETASATQQTVNAVHGAVIETQDTIAEVHTTTTETRGTVAEIYQTVAETHDDVQKLARAEPLPLVRDLTPDLFKMGDPFAERIAYYRKPPVEDVYSAATAALQAAASLPARGSEESAPLSPTARRGIVMMGEANAGKSRLMYEALTATLPDWSALLWSEARTTAEIPPPDVLRDRDVVIILDDLHSYASAASAEIEVPRMRPAASKDGLALVAIQDVAGGAEAVLQELVRSVRRDARRVVIAATCRSEHERATGAGLTWLLAQLVTLDAPRFSGKTDDPQTAELLAFLHAHGVAHPEREWAGTIGSGVLGLGEKHAEYLALINHHHPAVPVLRAMKLLTLAGVTRHTGRRVRTVCADVFGEPSVRDDEPVWQDAVTKLLDLYFVRAVEGRDGQTGLVIRNDPYFDYVVRDYPDPRIPGQVETHRSALLNVFTDLGDASALSSLARTFYNAGRLEDALTALRQSLTFDAQNVRNLIFMGALLLLFGRIDEALEAIEQALTLDPKDAFAWYWKGLALGSLGRSEEALAAYEQALTLDPNNAVAWRGKGAALISLGRYEEALEAIDRALTLNSTHAQFWNVKGLALGSLRRSEEALEAYGEALTLDPKRARAWVGKGRALGSLGRSEEALEAIDRALDLDPTNAVAWIGKGRALFSLGRYEEALPAYEQALTLAPTNAVAWRNKGSILRELGRLDEALDAYGHALELDPDNPWGWNGTAYILAAMKRYDEALTSIERAITLAPDNPDYHDSKGEILMMADRYDEALPCFEKAVSLDPAFVNSWKNLAIVYRRLGREADAQAAERKVQELGG